MRAAGYLVLAFAGCGRLGFDARSGDGPTGDAPVTCSPEVDLTSDPDNCGVCGHDCLGGGCTDSRCEPVAIASGQGDLRGIVVDATHVYWTGPGAVTRRAKGGGSLETVATFTGTGFRMIAIGGYLYWVTRNTGLVARAPMAAGDGTEIIATGQGDVGGIASDGTMAYWDNYPNDGNIFRGPIDGSSPPVALLPAPTDDLTGIRLVDDTLYFMIAAGGLWRIGVGGGTPVEVAPGIGSWEMAIDGDDVFLASAATDAIVRATLSGSVPPVTVAAADGPWGIAVDATHVYYANEAGNTIARAPRGGGAMEVLASAQVPVGIAVDADAVYWTTRGGDVVMIAR